MMRSVTILAAGVALMAVAGTVEAQLRLPADPPSIFKQPIVDLGAATVTPDIIYARPPAYRPLKLDLYQPKRHDKRLPAILWLHGGAWMFGDQRGAAFAGTDMPAMLADMASHGYVVAGVSYRLSGEAKFPAQIQDVRAAVRWLRANAETYNIDPAKVFIWGGSAGGYLASLVGLTCGEAGYEAPPGGGGRGGPPPATPPAGSECVQGVVAFYPVVTLTSLPDATDATGASGRLLGCAPQSCPPDKAALADVIGHIDAKDPPFLILHGDADQLVPIAQSRQLAEALKAKGVPVELVVVPGAGHVFPNLDPALRARLMSKVYAFLDAQSARRQ